MEDSILVSTKKLLGLGSDCSVFDVDIITHINTVIANLVQMGIGPSEGFMITGEQETWSDFVGDSIKINQIKTYVYLKVRLLFDPPTNGTLIESINKSIAECEWRMYVEKGGY